MAALLDRLQVGPVLKLQGRNLFIAPLHATRCNTCMFCRCRPVCLPAPLFIPGLRLPTARCQSPIVCCTLHMVQYIGYYVGPCGSALGLHTKNKGARCHDAHDRGKRQMPRPPFPLSWQLGRHREARSGVRRAPGRGLGQPGWAAGPPHLLTHTHTHKAS